MHREQMRIRDLALMTLLLLAGVGLGCGRRKTSVDGQRGQISWAIFPKLLSDYEKGIPAGLSESLEASPHLRGKVLVVDPRPLSTWIRGYATDPGDSPISVSFNVSVDAAHLKLPDELRPDHPDQVGTVAYAAYRPVHVGQYGSSSNPAFRLDCDITLIDRAKGVIYGRHTIEGPLPPAGIAISGLSGGVYGDPPTSDIASYLASLE